MKCVSYTPTIYRRILCCFSFVPSSHQTFGDSSSSFRTPLAPTTTTKTLPDFLRPFLLSVSPSVPFRKTVAFRSDQPTNQPTSPHNNDDGGGIPTNWHRTPLSWGSISPHSSPSLRAATCVASPPPSLPGFYYIGLICLRIHVRNFLRPLPLPPPSGGGCGAIRDSRSADASKKSPTKIELETHLRSKSPFLPQGADGVLTHFPLRRFLALERRTTLQFPKLKSMLPPARRLPPFRIHSVAHIVGHRRPPRPSSQIQSHSVLRGGDGGGGGMSSCHLQFPLDSVTHPKKVLPPRQRRRGGVNGLDKEEERLQHASQHLRRIGMRNIVGRLHHSITSRMLITTLT